MTKDKLKEILIVTTLGSEVRRLREERGMTLSELAAESHLGLRFIWSVEHDSEIEFTSWDVERLARALAISEDSILRLIPPRRLRNSNTGSAA